MGPVASANVCAVAAEEAPHLGVVELRSEKQEVRLVVVRLAGEQEGLRETHVTLLHRGDTKLICEVGLHHQLGGVRQPDDPAVAVRMVGDRVAVPFNRVGQTLATEDEAPRSAATGPDYECRPMC